MAEPQTRRVSWSSTAGKQEIRGVSVKGNGTFKAEEERWILQHEIRTR